MSASLTEFLAAHAWQGTDIYGDPSSTLCTCGWTGRSAGDRPDLTHAEHQAEFVLTWLLTQRKALESQVRREAHDVLPAGVVSVLPWQVAEAVLGALTEEVRKSREVGAQGESDNQVGAGRDVDLAALREAVEVAHKEVARLCAGGRWLMSVPAKPDRDSDLLISAGLNATKALITRVLENADPDNERRGTPM